MFPKMTVKNHMPVIFLGAKPEQQVASRFLHAVQTNPDDAWKFVSKVYSPLLDLDEIREVLGEGASFKIAGALYLDGHKNTRSVYVENPAKNLRRLLHLHLIKDGGAWKVFGAKLEECTRS